MKSLPKQHLSEQALHSLSVHDLMNSSVIIQDNVENIDLGLDYMVLAAEAGDRGAMVHVGKAFQTGAGLGSRR